MFRIITAVYRFLKKYVRLGIVLLCLNLLVLGLIGYTQLNMVVSMKYIERAVDIFLIGQQKQVHDFYEVLEVISKTEILQGKLNEEILKTIADLEENQEEIVKKIQETQTDVENADIYQQANFVLCNLSAGYSGSGTHIRIANKDYILTCAHLIKNPDDIFRALTEEDELVINLVDYDVNMDLALFRVSKIIKNIPALEIAEIAPDIGSEVIVVGNPSLYEDIVTNGVIAKKEKRTIIITNKVYSGNSGGAVIYKGKIIGVLVQTLVMQRFPLMQNYGVAVNLKTIHRFLEDCNLR